MYNRARFLFFFCGLNRYDPHRLMYLSAWPIGSGILRGMTLLKEVCHRSWGVRSCVLRLCSVWHTARLLLPAEQDTELPAVAEMLRHDAKH